MKPQEIRVQTANGEFGGLAWPNPGAPRLMCLHGWLDNAASFISLASFLQDFDMIALDLAGHGHSDHRPAGARYHMIDNLWDLDAVLDTLQWSDCILLGHSLGGVIASSLAAAAPERVSALVTFDGLGALSAPAKETARRLRASMESIRKAGSGLKDYPDVDAAAKSRQRASGLPFKIARLLCERSLKHEDGVYRWSTDPALNWRSPSLMTEEQVLDLLAAVSCPTLSIASSQVIEWLQSATLEKRLLAVPDCIHRSVDGHHHFHMDQPELTAQFILEFLNIPEHEDV